LQLALLAVAQFVKLVGDGKFVFDFRACTGLRFGFVEALYLPGDATEYVALQFDSALQVFLFLRLQIDAVGFIHHFPII
jgi:hypothetical protein